jgi:hypothetical protein
LTPNDIPHSLYQQKYEQLKYDTPDLKTKIEYLKKRHEYGKRKTDFLRNVYKRLVNNFSNCSLTLLFSVRHDIPYIEEELPASDDEGLLVGVKSLKKTHV